jgi:hypothetical protein
VRCEACSTAAIKSQRARLIQIDDPSLDRISTRRRSAPEHSITRREAATVTLVGVELVLVVDDQHAATDRFGWPYPRPGL